MRSRSCAASWPSRWKRNRRSGVTVGRALARQTWGVGLKPDLQGNRKGRFIANRPFFLERRSALLRDGHDRELDAAVLRAALLRIVGRDRMGLARADRDQALRLHAVARQVPS